MNLPEVKPEYYHRILHSLIRHNETPEEKQRARAAMEWMGNHVGELNKYHTATELRVLQIMLELYQANVTEYGPEADAPSYAMLRLEARHVVPADNVLLLLETYERHAKLFGNPHPAEDLTAVLNQRINNHTNVMFASVCAKATKMCISVVQGDDKEMLAGYGDASEYLIRKIREFGAPGVSIPRSGLAGELKENADTIRDGLIHRLTPDGQAGRVITGLGPIDEVVALGPGQDIRFVGLVGGSNQGKSAILLPMLSTAAANGKNVLLIPREIGVKAAWERLVWMHARHLPHVQLPSLNQWQLNPETITRADVAAFDEVVADLKYGYTFPGTITVAPASTWEDIVGYLTRHDNQRRFDVLAIDYIAHLDVLGKPNEQLEMRKQIFRKAQNLALDWRNGRGLLVISPMQANKAGVEKARGGEGVDYGSFAGDIGAVEWFTNAAQDSDLLIGVFQDNQLRQDGRFKISCIKSRGKFFEPFIAEADPVTRFVTALPGDGDIISRAIHEKHRKPYPERGTGVLRSFD